MILSFSRKENFRDADFSAMLAVWGNGNALKGYAIFYALTMRLLHARDLSPVFARSPDGALDAIEDGFAEFARAIQQEGENARLAAALDLAACTLRFYGGEWEA